MSKQKYALLTIAAGVVLMLASALMMIFSGPKKTPWELTNAMLPGTVTSAYVWSETLNSDHLTLTEDQIVTAVQLLTKLEKKDFTDNSRHAIAAPSYGLVLQYGESRLTLNETGASVIQLLLDEATAMSMDASDWLVDDAALSDFIRTLSGN